MSTAAALPAPMDERQRLTATLVISLLLHGLLILGVGFAVSEDAPLVPTLDVIFSQTSTPLTPKQADFLAQANQQGGGNHDTAQRPRDSQPGVVPQDRNGLAPQAQRATTVQAPLPTQTRVVSSRRGEQAVPTPQPNPQTDPLSPADAQRVQRDAEMARLAAEVHLRSEQYAKRPNRKFVSASTREYAYANYLRAWVDRAERVGNLNYPDEAPPPARRQGGNHRWRAPRRQRGKQPRTGLQRHPGAGCGRLAGGATGTAVSAAAAQQGRCRHPAGHPDLVVPARRRIARRPLSVHPRGAEWALPGHALLVNR